MMFENVQNENFWKHVYCLDGVFVFCFFFLKFTRPSDIFSNRLTHPVMDNDDDGVTRYIVLFLIFLLLIDARAQRTGDTRRRT